MGIAMTKFPRPDGVIFDCDSTLSAIEGIDELATLKNCRAQVEALTNQAMNGEVLLEAVYAKRLDIISPSQKDIEKVAQQYLETITPGAPEIIQLLQKSGIQVAIISGGLRTAILPLAHHLGIADADVFAVDLQFDATGQYQRVLSSPLTTATGKCEVATQWKRQHQLQRVYMIGDGMSDVAAKGEGAADLVIGYGGVIVRDAVREASDYFLTSPSLTALLDIWES